MTSIELPAPQTETKREERENRRKAKRDSLENLYQKGELFPGIEKIRLAGAPKIFWGNWLIQGTIITESGTGGVSKTSFNTALFTSLQDEQEFLGVKGFPIKVLYLDFESAEALIKSRLNLLGRLQQKRQFFRYCNLPDTTFKDLEPFIERFIDDHYPPDVIFIDPVRLAFSYLENLNDNADVGRVISHERDLVGKWGTTLVNVAHVSKADGDRALGATAWEDLADVLWNFRSLGKGYNSNLFYLQIRKNRWINDELVQCIKKEGGEFIPVDFPDNWGVPEMKNYGMAVMGVIDKLRKAFAEKSLREQKELFACCGLNASSHADISKLYRALTALMARQEINRISRGVYESEAK